MNGHREPKKRNSAKRRQSLREQRTRTQKQIEEIKKRFDADLRIVFLNAKPQTLVSSVETILRQKGKLSPDLVTEFRKIIPDRADDLKLDSNQRKKLVEIYIKALEQIKKS